MSAMEESAVPVPAIPPDYNGMRVEVYNTEGQLLFEAVLKIINRRLVILDRSSEPLPGITDDIPVHIRGFHFARNLGVHMRGRLTRLAPTQDREWIVGEASVTGADRGRIFSRVPLEVNAWISPEPDGPWEECTAVNASAGGVRIRSARALEAGSRLYIRFELRRGREQPPLLCEVRRGMEREDVYECGCEFVEITPEVESVIAKTIIELHLLDTESEIMTITKA